MAAMRQAGQRTGRVLQDYLRLVPAEDYYTDSLIELMIDNESELDGTAYLFMSVHNNQSLATARTHIPDLGYRMYAASIRIIMQRSQYAMVTGNKALLRRCEKENLRVYQNKEEAEQTNAAMEQHFGKNEHE